MQTATHVPRAGFTEPVSQSQTVFRALLDASANPSRICSIGHHVPDAPVALPSAVAAALLTLSDYDTPIFLSPRFNHDDVRAWLTFHAGCSFVDDPHDAAFGVIDGSPDDPSLSAFNVGDERYPDRSATVFVVCDALRGGANITLSGPGIAHEAEIAPQGVLGGFWDVVAANHQRFPMGVDLMLVAQGELLALPRSTSVRFKETV
jgi:alpha-D-ribose 1-methylphosphonate 5-triphosphate synthase subunit PhnH